MVRTRNRKCEVTRPPCPHKPWSLEWLAEAHPNEIVDAMMPREQDFSPEEDDEDE